jgi:hypothetical protein
VPKIRIPKLTKADKVAGEIKATAKRPRNYIKNLKGFAFAKGAKLPTNAKIGAGTVKKTTKAKMLSKRAQKGAHLNV